MPSEAGHVPRSSTGRARPCAASARSTTRSSISPRSTSPCSTSRSRPRSAATSTSTPGRGAHVDSYAGFLFVFPQYNWGYPGALKNALDFLFHEWRDKPTTQLTYGSRGGNRAAEQFDVVLHGLHMQVLDTRIEAVVTDVDLDDSRRLADPASTLAPNRDALLAIDAEMTRAVTAAGT